MIIKGATISVLADDVPDDGFHKPLLEVERCLDTCKGQLQEPVAQALGQPRHKTLQNQLELAVIQQVIERLFHLLRLVRPDLVEFVHINQTGSLQYLTTHLPCSVLRHVPAEE